MKRSQLNRKTPLTRGAAPSRRTRVKAVNPERRAEKYARNFGDEADAVRAMPCAAQRIVPADAIIEGQLCSGRVAAAHVTARGMGASNGGRFDLVPLCDAHHREAGEAGTSMRAAFEERYGLDLRRLADDIALGMPEPLGIRGLIGRLMDAWPPIDGLSMSDALAWVFGQGHYDVEALLGWVLRRIERVFVENPDALGEGAVLAVLVTELGLSIDAAGQLCDAAGWPT